MCLTALFSTQCLKLVILTRYLPQSCVPFSGLNWQEKWSAQLYALPQADIKCIRPKASKFLDSEIKEALVNPSDSSPSNVQSCASKNAKKYYPPIPAAEYVSSKFSVLTPVAPDESPSSLLQIFLRIKLNVDLINDGNL